MNTRAVFSAVLKWRCPQVCQFLFSSLSQVIGEEAVFLHSPGRCFRCLDCTSARALERYFSGHDFWLTKAVDFNDSCLFLRQEFSK